MSAPLSHIRVLDLSRILAGPLATQFLADMGAEVIKVERPGSGDDTRGWGPPFAIDPDENDPGLSAYFMCCNRGKKSVAIDMATPQGQDLIRKLAAEVDVVVENFKVGGLAKYGLDYETLKKTNPGLVYCSITGFGQDGPYARRAGYDFLLQGMGGLMSITGEPDATTADGRHVGGPVKVGVAICDEVTGLNATAAILSALIARDRTGEGRHIDIALLDATVAALVNQASTHLVDGSVPGRMGNAHPTVAPYNAFQTADGHIILACGNDGQFQRFCKVAGLEQLASDPRFRTNPDRIRNRDDWMPVLEEAFRARPSAWWIEQLEAEGVPCGPINSIDEVFADPQIQHRRMRRELPEPTLGYVAVTANPVRMTGHDTTAPKAPPRLGADTGDVLKDVLGLDDERLASLAQKGIIAGG
jgi:crotonobetainyl-CoA:carnitine CoA-transferase CaiB-like acyl-CoA transferase